MIPRPRSRRNRAGFGNLLNLPCPPVDNIRSEAPRDFPCDQLRPGPALPLPPCWRRSTGRLHQGRLRSSSSLVSEAVPWPLATKYPACAVTVAVVASFPSRSSSSIGVNGTSTLDDPAGITTLSTAGLELGSAT